MSEVEVQETRRTLIGEEMWQQPRVGRIFEVEMADGRLKYNIQISDVGRPSPFIDQVFSKEESARSLLERVMQQGGKIQEEEEDSRSLTKTRKK